LRTSRSGAARIYKIPLGSIAQMRTQIEAELILQNIFLTADAMGLGAWIHATVLPPILLGDPKFRKTYGKMLDFDHVVPKWKPADLLRWQIPVPKFANLRAHPVGLRHKGEHLIKGSCSPYYDTMTEAVNNVIARKFGPKGIYRDTAVFDQIYKDGFAKTYLHDASDYSTEVIECARHLQLHLRNARSLSGACRYNLRSGRLAAGAQGRRRLL
jgi:hypothetical protein